MSMSGDGAVLFTRSANGDDFSADVGSPPLGRSEDFQGPRSNPQSPSNFDLDFLVDSNGFPGHAGGQLNDLSSLGLSVGLNLAELNLDFFNQQPNAGSDNSEYNVMAAAEHGEDSAMHDGFSADDFHGTMASGSSESAQDTLAWNNLSVEQQLLLLQRPDFLSGFSGVHGTGLGQPGFGSAGQQLQQPQLVFPTGLQLPLSNPGTRMEDVSAEGSSGSNVQSPSDAASPNSDPAVSASPKRGRVKRVTSSMATKSPGRGRSGVMAISDSGVILDQRIEDDRSVRLSPLVSPAMTPSMDFQRMNLASTTGLTPLTSPALVPSRFDQVESGAAAQGRSPTFGPTRVVGGQQTQSPVLSAAPYQVPSGGRRRAPKGSSPSLGPNNGSPRLGPSAMAREASQERLAKKVQSPRMPGSLQGLPPAELAVSMAQFASSSIGESTVGNKLGGMPVEVLLSSARNSPVFSNNSGTPVFPSPRALGPGGAGKKGSPLLVASRSGLNQTMAPLPPPAMGPVTPSSLMNLGRSASGQYSDQFAQPLPMYHLTPPLGPTEHYYESETNAPLEARRSSHKVAEQKRRDSLRMCFDNLKDLLPQEVIKDEKNPSKVFILKKSSDYIRGLLARQRETEDTVRRLKQEVNDLRTSINRGNRAAEGDGNGDREMREYEDFRRWKRQFEEREREEPPEPVQRAEKNAAAAPGRPASRASAKAAGKPAAASGRGTARAGRNAPPQKEDEEDDDESMEDSESE